MAGMTRKRYLKRRTSIMEQSRDPSLDKRLNKDKKENLQKKLI
jgi:hypothetical protein